MLVFVIIAVKMFFQVLCTLALFIITTFSLLIILMAVLLSSSRKQSFMPFAMDEKKASTMVVLGSGGHTMEMMKLMSALSFEWYQPRIYVMAKSDQRSQNKLQEVEEEKSSDTEFHVEKIPRSRELHQSLFTAFFTTLFSWFWTIPMVWKHQPDLVLCNGPGTCVPVCLTALIFKAFRLKQITIIYVESICRVKSLSFAGLLLLHLVDRFIVQWPELHQKYPSTLYLGRLV